MKKASRILLLVGAILAIVASAILFFDGFLYIWLYSDANKEIVEQVIAESGYALPEGSTIEQFMAFCRLIGGVLVGISTLYIPSVILSFIARAKQNKPFYIAAIVCGGIAGNICSVLGGIFGLITSSSNNNPQSFPSSNTVVEANIIDNNELQ